MTRMGDSDEFEMEGLDEAALTAIENDSKSSRNPSTSTSAINKQPMKSNSKSNGGGKFRPANIKNHQAAISKTVSTSTSTSNPSAKIQPKPAPSSIDAQVDDDLFDDSWDVDVDMLEEMENEVQQQRGNPSRIGSSGIGNGNGGGESSRRQFNNGENPSRYNSNSNSINSFNSGAKKGAEGQNSGMNPSVSYSVGGAGPSASTSNNSTSNPNSRSIYNEVSTTNNNRGQLDLFGNKVIPKPVQAKSNLESQQQQASTSSSKTLTSSGDGNKVWDESKLREDYDTGKKKKGKGKGRQLDSDSEDLFNDDDDDQEWELPRSNDDLREEQARNNSNQTKTTELGKGKKIEMRLKIDQEAAKTWIYPTNMERRDYQFNIVKLALFNNVLCAIPTGLGKTFIAAVIVLNYFRWYPKGKLIFLCPSRPLVAQQQISCHKICGLPWDSAIDLTGSKASSIRIEEYKEKRIFYMTPQTLENDLRTKKIDPLDIITVVVDEAHRSTGNYSYCNVVREITKYNPWFRVLALTATPGNNVEKIQQVIDKLHISKVEIRTEEMLDIRKYVHKKKEVVEVIKFSPEMAKIRDQWSKLMKTFMDPCVAAGLVYNPNPLFLKPFSCLAASKSSENREVFKSKPFLKGNLMTLRSMASAMQLLNEFSANAFLEEILKQSDSTSNSGGKSGKPSQRSKVISNSNSTFAEMKRSLLSLQEPGTGKITHPKMNRLFEILEEHFSKAKEKELELEELHWDTPAGLAGGNLPPSASAETRAMVFCSSRDVTLEIVQYLNSKGLSVAQFVGQAADGKGRAGLKQKDQQKVIEDFKKGKYNVLVATQIGEEGLDIGEIDLIVCYEAPKDPIRMLQRVGRTGRKRDGKVVILACEGPDQDNYRKSKETYKNIQRSVTEGNQLELYCDVPRLVPDYIFPVCEEKELEQPDFDPEVFTRKPSRSKKEVKEKVVKDPKRNIPKTGTIKEGFVKASDLRKKSPIKIEEKKMLSDLETDSEDEKLNDGISFSGNFTSKKNRLKAEETVNAPKTKSKLILPTPPRKKAFDLKVGTTSASKSASASGSGSVKDQATIEISDDSEVEAQFKSRKSLDHPVSKSKSKSKCQSQSQPRPQPEPVVIDSEGDELDMSLDLNSDELRELEMEADQGGAGRVAGDDEEVDEQAQSRERTNSSGSESPKPTIKRTMHPLMRELAAELSDFGRSEDEKDQEKELQIDSDLDLESESELKPKEKPNGTQSRSLRDVTNGFDGEDFGDDFDLDDEDLMALDEEQNQVSNQDENEKDEGSQVQIRGSAVLAPSSSPIVIDDEDPPEKSKKSDSVVVDGDEEDSPMPMAGRKRVKMNHPNPTATSSVPRPRHSSNNVIDDSPMPLAVRRRKKAKPQVHDSSSPRVVDDDRELMGPPSAGPSAGPSRIKGKQRFVRASDLARGGGGGDDDDEDDDSDDAPLVQNKGKGKSKVVEIDSDEEESNVKSKKRKATSSKSDSKSKKKTKSTSSEEKRIKKKKKIGNSPTSKALFRYEADRSTDEDQHGDGDEDDEGVSTDQEDESDRRFAGDFDVTQADPGYDQQAMYARSLMTQVAPTPFKGKSRGGGFYGGRFGQQTTPGGSRVQDRWAGFQATPRNPADSSDRYDSQDSFVAGSDEEVEYMGDSGPGSSQL